MAPTQSVQCFGKKKTATAVAHCKSWRLAWFWFGCEIGREKRRTTKLDKDKNKTDMRQDFNTTEEIASMEETKSQKRKARRRQHGVPGNHRRYGNKFADETLQSQSGSGLIKVNGQPLSLVQPQILRFKVYEPLLVIGLDKFAGVDIRVRVTGGGHTSQIYAIRQAIAKALIAYYQKFVDEHSKNTLKTAFTQYDRTLLVADNRRCEPKKFGGPGARARFQKSYR
ncbi:hypothetical protein G7054_g665 [Neopestalotiopsis clavispora]|nr:hypothetical protein G7054_g665 [Neopestalotiopsis clavispora]